MKVNGENAYSPGEVAKMLGVSSRTVQSWDYKGVFPARRTPTGRRYYTQDDVQRMMGKDPYASEEKRINVIYCRVSSRNQKDDLKNQKDFLRTFCNARGVIVEQVIEDIGSGLNYKRKNWLNLIWDVLDRKIDTVYIAHKDRFVRFGFSFFEELFERFGTKIIVAVNEDLSPAEEMVQDIISILHVFSCRIYGLRKYVGKIKEDKEMPQGKAKEFEDPQIKEEI